MVVSAGAINPGSKPGFPGLLLFAPPPPPPAPSRERLQGRGIPEDYPGKDCVGFRFGDPGDIRDRVVSAGAISWARARLQVRGVLGGHPGWLCRLGLSGRISRFGVFSLTSALSRRAFIGAFIPSHCSRIRKAILMVLRSNSRTGQLTWTAQSRPGSEVNGTSMV